MEIIVKRYEHYNTALGKYISSKREYHNELSKRGMISYDKACEIADKVQKENKKEYKIGGKALGIIKHAKDIADRKGNVKLGSKAIDAMKEVGVKFNTPDNLPKHYREGGFN